MTTIKHLITILLSVVFAQAYPAIASTNGNATEKAQYLSIGIVPQQAAGKLLLTWSPLLNWLHKETGIQIRFKTATDIPTFESRLAAGQYDLAYMNPYHFTVFNTSEHGYHAMVKAKDKLIKGIIVVHKDSTLTQLEELNNQSLAFPAPAAFAATVLPSSNLKARNINFEANYVSSHDSVYKGVAEGFFPAGGGVMRTLKASTPKIREQLRILWKTPGYTPHALAVHSSVDPAMVKRIKSALLKVDSVDPAVLNGLKIKGFEAALDSDWDDVRALNIDTRLIKMK